MLEVWEFMTSDPFMVIVLGFIIAAFLGAVHTGFEMWKYRK